MNERKKTRKITEYPSLDGKLSEVRDEIAGLISKYGEDAEITIDTDDDEHGVEIILTIEVDESDEQMHRRVAQETRFRDQNEARDRAEYARLVEKFAAKAAAVGAALDAKPVKP